MISLYPPACPSSSSFGSYRRSSDASMYSVYRNTPSMLSFSSAGSSNFSELSLVQNSSNSPALSSPPSTAVNSANTPGTNAHSFENHNFSTDDQMPSLPITSQNGIVTVLDFSPQQGEAGSRIIVNIGFRQLAGRVIGLRVVFSGMALRTLVAHGHGKGHWQLKAEVPALNNGIANTTHTLQIEALEGGNVIDSVIFGTFTYWEGGSGPVATTSTPPSQPGPARRVRSFDQRSGGRHSPLLTRHNSHSSYANSLLSQSLAAATLSAPTLPISTSSPSTGSALRPQFAQPDPYRIVRRTEIPIEREASALSVVMSIHGELRSMATGWSQEEVKARRRLVQFWRHTEGPVVNVHFCPIKPEEYDDTRIVVSCIYREDVDKCFITSFDLIRLLEGIIGSVCNIDEKNRIRRNVHHIEHDTISKSKPYHEEFFDLIMSFPTPMPRRNVRDLKAFRWEYLSEALHAIIDKMALDYCPSSVSEMVEPSIPEVPEPEPSFSPGNYATSINTDHSSVYNARMGSPMFNDSMYDFRSPSMPIFDHHSPNQSVASFQTPHSPNESSASFQFHHAQSPGASVSSFGLYAQSPSASTTNFSQGHSPGMMHQQPDQLMMDVQINSPAMRSGRTPTGSFTRIGGDEFGGNLDFYSSNDALPMSLHQQTLARMTSHSSLDGALGGGFDPTHYNANGFYIGPQ